MNAMVICYEQWDTLHRKDPLLDLLDLLMTSPTWPHYDVIHLTLIWRHPIDLIMTSPLGLNMTSPTRPQYDCTPLTPIWRHPLDLIMTSPTWPHYGVIMHPDHTWPHYVHTLPHYDVTHLNIEPTWEFYTIPHETILYITRIIHIINHEYYDHPLPATGYWEILWFTSACRDIIHNICFQCLCWTQGKKLEKCVRFRALARGIERFFACSTRYAMKIMRALASNGFHSGSSSSKQCISSRLVHLKEPCVTISPLVFIVRISWPTVCINNGNVLPTTLGTSDSYNTITWWLREI